jgi:hypothetical protein
MNTTEQDTQPKTNDEHIDELVDAWPNQPFRIVDHGLEWERVGNQQWASLDGYALICIKNRETGVISYGVVSEATQEPIMPPGTARSWKEARRNAVFALGAFLEADTPELPTSAPMRFAATLVLGLVAAVIAVGMWVAG